MRIITSPILDLPAEVRDIIFGYLPTLHKIKVLNYVDLRTVFAPYKVEELLIFNTASYISPRLSIMTTQSYLNSNLCCANCKLIPNPIDTIDWVGPDLHYQRTWKAIKLILDDITNATYLDRIVLIYKTQHYVYITSDLDIHDIAAYVDNILFNTAHILADAELCSFPSDQQTCMGTYKFLAQQTENLFSLSDYIHEIYRYTYNSLYSFITYTLKMTLIQVNIKTHILDKYFHCRDNEPAMYRIICVKNSLNAYRYLNKYTAYCQTGNPLERRGKIALYIGGKYCIHLHSFLGTPSGYLLKPAHIEQMLQNPLIEPLLPQWSTAIRRGWPELLEDSAIVKKAILGVL